MFRKILVLLLIIICVSLPLYAGGNRWSSKPPLGSVVDWSHPLSKGLVGCWLMNEGGGNIIKDLADKTGRMTPIVAGKNPTWSISPKGIAPKCIYVNGDPGASYYFGTTNLTIPDIFSVVTGVYVLSKGGQNVMCSKRQNYNSTDGFSIFSGYNGTTDVAFSVNNQIIASALNLIADKSFYQFSMTYDLANIKGYLNNKNVVSGAYTTVPTQNTEPLRIACGVSYNVFEQAIYLYIYNRALSLSEIQQLYQDPYCVINPPTIWSMFSTAVAAARRMWISN